MDALTELQQRGLTGNRRLLAAAIALNALTAAERDLAGLLADIRAAHGPERATLRGYVGFALQRVRRARGVYRRACHRQFTREAA